MDTLHELRGQLDEIDAQIVDLYQKRMDICGKVGEYKITAGKKVFDKQREKEKLAAVTADVSTEQSLNLITRLFGSLVPPTKIPVLQRPFTVAFLTATFST